MEGCVVNNGFFQAANYCLYAVLLLAGVAFVNRDKKSTAICLITALFFFLPSYFHCEIKAFDAGRVYRYLIWVTLDLLYLFTVYFAVVSRLRVLRLVWVGLVYCHVCLWVSHLIRIVDVHFLAKIDLSAEYGFSVGALNFLIVLLIFTQVTAGFTKELLRGKHGKNNNNFGCNDVDSGSFMARIKDAEKDPL